MGLSMEKYIPKDLSTNYGRQQNSVGKKLITEQKFIGNYQGIYQRIINENPMVNIWKIGLPFRQFNNKFK